MAKLGTPITLRALRDRGACEDGVDWLLARLPVGWGEDAEIHLADHLDPARIEYVVWALSEFWPDRERRLFALDCAEHVQRFYDEYYPDDDRVDALNRATRACLENPNDAARDAAWAAARAALDARYAARAALDAARAAARAAARDARYAARAAGDAEAQWQCERIRYYLEASDAE